jgi:hypothetical protein
MIKLELTMDEINNLMVFLERVELKGKEVPAYNVLVYKTQQAVQKSQQQQTDGEG